MEAFDLFWVPFHLWNIYVLWKFIKDYMGWLLLETTESLYSIRQKLSDETHNWRELVDVLSWYKWKQKTHPCAHAAIFKYQFQAYTLNVVICPA